MNQSDLRRVWDKAKHGKVSERDIVACEQLLENPPAEDIHLAILTIGLTRKANDRIVRIVETYLHDGRTDAERYCSMRVLCRYWRMWERYLPVLYSRLGASAWEDDHAIATEAIALVGEYLFGTDDKEAWKNLVKVYDEAEKLGDTEMVNVAYGAIFVALNGPKMALDERLSGDHVADDEMVQRARDRARLS